MQIGKDGLTCVWDLVAKKWKRVYPVDAREMIKLGVASVSCPEDKAPEPPPEKSAPLGTVSQPDFSRYNVPQLQGFADEAGIPNFRSMNKATLIESLLQVGFVPEN